MVERGVLKQAWSFWTVQKERLVDGEIVVARRRQWTPEEKAALIAEVDAADGRVLLVARRHGISKSLLYNWRSAWKAARRAALPAEFVQLGVVTDASGQSRTMPMRRRQYARAARV